MSVILNRDGNVLTMHMDTTMGGQEAPEWEKQVEREVDESVETVIMDCSDLTYISSAGLRVILKIQKKMDLTDGELILTNVSPAVMDVLDIVGFSGFLTIEQSNVKVEERNGK